MEVIFNKVSCTILKKKKKNGLMWAGCDLTEINVEFCIWVAKTLYSCTRWGILFWVVVYVIRILGVWWAANCVWCGNKEGKFGLNQQRTRDLMVPLIRPHLAYNVQFWRPFNRKNIETLGLGAEEAMRLIRDLETEPFYNERLWGLGMFSLVKKRLWGYGYSFQVLEGLWFREG